jgi:hypothetical protein
MPNLADWLKPEWIIPIVGVVVALAIFVLLRNLGKRDDPQLPPVNPAVKKEDSARSERRATPRKKTPPIVVDLIDPDGIQPRRTALVVDRSTGGLALQSQDEIPVESKWTVVPRAQQGPVKVSVPVEVRNCERGEQGYMIRCQFLRTVTYNELMSFGSV